MAQILSASTYEQSDQILCCYFNPTSQIQIMRIANIAHWYFERVVFPGQRLMFAAPSEAQLEIHTAKIATAILSDRIACKRLRVREGLVSVNFA